MRESQIRPSLRSGLPGSPSTQQISYDLVHTTGRRMGSGHVNFGPAMRRPDGTLIKKGGPGWLARSERPYAQQKAGLLPRRFHYRTDAPLSFVSPNTLEIPGVTEAERQFKSDIHNRFVDQAHALAQDMGLNVVIEPALGSWS